VKYKFVWTVDVGEIVRSAWNEFWFGFFVGYHEWPRDWKERGWLKPLQKIVGLGFARIQWVSDGPITRTEQAQVVRTITRPPLTIE